MIGLLLLSVITLGCQSRSSSQQARLTSRLTEDFDINPMQLMGEFTLRMDNALAESIATFSDLAAEYPDRHVQEHCLRWKMRSLDFYLAILSVDDPRAAFLIAWTASVNMRQFFTTGAGKEAVGPAQPRIAVLAQNFENKLLDLGYRHFPKETMDAARDEIEESALEFLWNAPITQATAQAEAQDEVDLMRILQLPIKPFTDLGKVGNTPEAISQFTNTANDFSLVIRYLPERMRWQMQMLLLEMESSGPTVVITKQIQDVEQRVQDMIVLFKAMPADIRQEFEKSIEATKKSLPEFRAMLKEARAVAESTNSTIENANQTTLQAQKAAVQFTETARAFEVAVVETRALLTDYLQWRNLNEPNKPMPSDAEEQKKAGPQDYQQMSESIKSAALEVRSLIDKLQQPLDDEGSLRQVTGELQGLLSTIFRYSVALVCIIFVSALAYRLAARRLVPKRE